MKTEQVFEIELERKLSEKKFESVLEALKNPGNASIIDANVWNFINTVCLTLKTKDLVQNEDDVEICKNILLNLVDRGTAKEVIVALMEDADSFKNHFHFCLLLEPLKHTLKKVPGKRGKSLEWVLSTLNAHIQTLPEPNDTDLQGEEKLLLDMDPAVVDTNYVLTNYFQFIDTFVSEVSFETMSTRVECFSDRIVNQREILQRFILILFSHPFLYHDLHVENPTRPKSTIRVLCEKYIRCLSKICSNVYNLFRYDSAFAKKEAERDDSEIVPTLAFANLSYLIFVENITSDFQPFVYNHRHVFVMNIKYIVLLLSKTENLVLFKGLHLAKTLLDNLEDFDITYDFVELPDFTKFPSVLLNIGILCQIETHRRMAVKIFLTYVNRCDWKGRYHLINQVLCTIDHSGAKGLVINLFKTYLNYHLNNGMLDGYFMGKNLKSLLKKLFQLEAGAETDILPNSDEIITTLNFLRYLLIRDRVFPNVTGIRDLLPEITEKFFEPLKTGLDLSRAHYQLATKDASSGRKKEGDSINATVSVNNEILPNIPPNFQKDVIDRALLTFDVIESLLCRVQELV
ncbi:glomulin [Trichonephila clavata]|uniref:Glomulin n=1 Tax=Trichonephila clavata TaxID=2740835 RepID=A0A8X6LEE6_TRICU|nr:glomulin [Trichonephila clavata]